MPSSQAAATERRNSDSSTMPHEPPKLKTTLKTPPKQATNPLQFVKVGPCALYRSAQEQLSKVQEVIKVKPEVRDDPEDWQSNLDNWKSSRRKRQEHIIERVVEVKKLELEEHDRQRRRSKTFSEMMEERGNRGRKLSISLAVYNEEDANDLSDLGIGTSSGKSSVSGDTHDDSHSLLSDRDSEIDKNHSDVDNAHHENGADGNDTGATIGTTATDSSGSNSSTTATTTTPTTSKCIIPTPPAATTKTTSTAAATAPKKLELNNGFHKIDSNGHHRKSDSSDSLSTTTTEPEEYTYEGAIRGYVSRVAQSIPRRSLAELDAKLANNKAGSPEQETRLNGAAIGPPVKVDILKRREIFEKASLEGSGVISRPEPPPPPPPSGKSIKERLSVLERQKRGESEETAQAAVAKERASSRERKELLRTRDVVAEELEGVLPLRERLSNLEKFTASEQSSSAGSTAQPLKTQQQQQPSQLRDEFNVKTIKERLVSLDSSRPKHQVEERGVSNSLFEPRPQQHQHHHASSTRAECNSTPSERSSSPDSEYRSPRGATFHQSLDSLDADASSGPDTFERVQSLEELDYQHQARRYPASNSSAELLNDTDREDSGIHTADASCSVSQADEPIADEESTPALPEKQQRQPQSIVEETTEFRGAIETTTQLMEALACAASPESVARSRVEDTDKSAGSSEQMPEPQPRQAVLAETGTAGLSLSSSTLAGDAIASTTKSEAVEVDLVLGRPTNADSIERVESSSKPALDHRDDDDDDKTLSAAAILCSRLPFSSSSQRPVVYQSPRIPPRRSPPSYLPGLQQPTIPTPATTSFSPESPRPQPRLLSPSKIPTPLPRKSLSSPASPLKCPLSPPKAQRSCLPVPLGKAPSSSSCPTSPLAACRGSGGSVAGVEPVVEVCEKVLVPRGRAHATPFISVETGVLGAAAEPQVEETPAQQQQQHEEPHRMDEQQQQQLEKMEKEEVEEEEEEMKRLEEELMVEASEEQQQLQLTIVPVNKSVPSQPSAIQPEPMSPFSMGDDDTQREPPPPVRPTSLALERTTLCPDFLSPLSPASKPILPLSFSSDEEIVAGLSFPLGPPTSVEPPKEKPPPPPVDLSDEENHPIEPLKRLNSTRRIKKELRTRRSDFLGIEGFNDDELERELTLSKPPDMAAILAEERRIEQLHRRSYDTDSNYEQDSSHERDSGVELGQAEDWAKQTVSPDMSQHSRQSSEPFGASVTSSEEDELNKKEREEQWRYEDERDINGDIGEKLAYKLRELEEEKRELERKCAAQNLNDDQQQQQQPQPQRRWVQEPTAETLRMNEENLRKQEELSRQQDEAEQKQLELQRAEEKRQEELRMQEQLRIQQERDMRNAEVRGQEELQSRNVEKIQENNAVSPAPSSNSDEYSTRQEVLRVERELLQLEQEELKRQRTNLAYREHKQQQLAEQLQEQWKALQQEVVPPPVSRQNQPTSHYAKAQPIQPHPPIVNYRSSMPNLPMQLELVPPPASSLAQKRRPPPPPIPPAKPLRLVEQRQRDVSIRNSRIPSADSIPQQVEAPLRPSRSATILSPQQQQQQQHTQQMSRQTLQALSAVPRPRMIQADQWVQRRKSDVPRGAHDYSNYQHWLIQEAEQRRITEQNQRSPGARKPHVTGTTVLPYQATPPKTDSKPLPDSIIQTLTQRVQNRVQDKPLSPRRRLEHSTSQEHLHASQHYQLQPHKIHQSPSSNNGVSNNNNNSESQEKMLSVSGKKKCSHCGDELGRGAAMIIESLRLFYHMECFKCCVCHVRLGDGLMGTDVRVRNHKLHCHNCYSSDDGVKFSCV